MNGLFIFTQDNSWAGCIFVIAKTEEQARKLMQAERNYEPEREVEKHEFSEGFVYANYGDL